MVAENTREEKRIIQSQCTCGSIIYLSLAWLRATDVMHIYLDILAYPSFDIDRVKNRSYSIFSKMVKSSPQYKRIEYLMLTSFPSSTILASPLSILTPSPWLLLQKLWSASRLVLNGSFSVTYSFYVLPLLLVAKNVQLFPGLGVYSGIFAIYLQYPSNVSKTRTANVIFYILCLLYFFCAATVVSDLLTFVLGVSNNPICMNIVFIISWAVSTSNWLRVNIKSHGGCPRHSKCLLWLHRPMHHSTHKPLYPSSVLFT